MLEALLLPSLLSMETMQKSNYHSHCAFCDGRSMPEEFVRFAIARGFRAYGFSSHSPLPFETFWNMSRDDMPDYIAEISRLKAKYSDKIEIYTALEIDYLDETYNPSIPYFRELPLDYRIGSVHFLPVAQPLAEKNMMCIDGSLSDFRTSLERYFGGDIQKLVARYFNAVQQMVLAGGIDIVGHLDKIYMNGQRCEGFSFDASWYKDAFCETLDMISEKGLMVEINTKNLVKRRETYPHMVFLGMLKERNIPVMVNSDCHIPDLVNDGRSEAFDLLKATGFASTRELVGGKWEDVAL